MVTDWFSALDALLTPLGSSSLELFGFVFGVIAVALMVRERIAAWPVGMVNTAIYAVVFQRAGLYSDAGLQVVYIGLSAYGWWHWWHGARSGGDEVPTPLPVTRTPPRDAWIAGTGAIAGWLLLATITSRLPGTSLPWLDAALVSGSLATQWLAARKRVENWVCWIVLDVVYVGMFVHKQLYLTAVLYAVFTLLAIRGHRAWTASMRGVRV